MSDIPPPPPPPASPPPPPPNPSGSGGVIGSGISWAISAFGKNVATFIGLAAVVMVVGLLSQLLTRTIDSRLAVSDACETLKTQAEINDCLARNAGGLFSGLFLTLALSLIVTVLLILAEIGIINSALKVTRGEKAQFSNIWHPQHGWLYVFTALIYGIAVAFGLLLCLIPGLLMIWFWQFCRFAALDRGKSIGDSFGYSIQLVMAHKGEAILTLLVVFVAELIVTWTCGIAALVIAPFVALFMAYVYRRWSGEEVPAPA